MDQDIGYWQYLNRRARDSYRLSWTAYVVPAAFVLVCGAFAPALYHWRPWTGVAFFLFCLLAGIAVFLSRRAVRLYLNDQGIWVSAGFLPWTKGVNGVHWDDVDHARFFPGSFARTFNSYRIRVGHRLTQTRGISLGCIANGHRFVEDINRRLTERPRFDTPNPLDR